MQLIIKENIESLTNVLSNAYTALNGDLSPLTRSIADWVRDSTVERFINKADPDGRAWQPLSPLTKRLKGNDNILVDNQNLLNSITSYYTASSAVVGTNVDYAATHQFGAVIHPEKGKYLRFGNKNGGASLTSVTIPARPFFGLSAADEQEIITLATDFAAGLFDD